jgi:hypothetical protein
MPPTLVTSACDGLRGNPRAERANLCQHGQIRADEPAPPIRSTVSAPCSGSRPTIVTA